MAEPSPTTNRSKWGGGGDEKPNYYRFKDEKLLAPTTKAIRRVGGAGEQAAPAGAGMQRPHLAGEGKGKEEGKGKKRGKKGKRRGTPHPQPRPRGQMSRCVRTRPPGRRRERSPAAYPENDIEAEDEIFDATTDFRPLVVLPGHPLGS